MRTLWEVFHLFVCVILSRFNAVTSVTFVENGNNLTLNPNISGKPEEILWTFNESKVADYNFNEFEAYGQFKGRSSIELTTGQLIVRHMTSQDSGIYRSEIQIDGKYQKSENEVQVIDALQKPVVTCKLTTESKTLFCSASSNSTISFEWTGSNSIQHSKQELNISKEEKPDAVFTCTVKNEVSQKNTSFTLKDCNTDDPQSDMNTMLPLVIIGAIILGIAAVFIYLIHKKINKDTRTSRVETKDDVQESLIEGKMCKLSETEAQTMILSNHNAKPQEITDAENMSKEMELDETSKALSDNPDPSDQRSKSGKDLHNCEDDEHETGEAQDLTGPAQANSSNKLNEKHWTAGTPK